jgi:hypothetical protein
MRSLGTGLREKEKDFSVIRKLPEPFLLPRSLSGNPVREHYSAHFPSVDTTWEIFPKLPKFYQGAYKISKPENKN